MVPRLPGSQKSGAMPYYCVSRMCVADKFYLKPSPMLIIKLNKLLVSRKLNPSKFYESEFMLKAKGFISIGINKKV